jgi:hypothetical protein
MPAGAQRPSQSVTFTAACDFIGRAGVLGDSPAIIRKHYAKWSAGRQTRIIDLLARIGHAKKPQSQDTENKEGNLVDDVGLEPTTPALRTRCSPN